MMKVICNFLIFNQLKSTQILCIAEEPDKSIKPECNGPIKTIRIQKMKQYVDTQINSYVLHKLSGWVGIGLA